MKIQERTRLWRYLTPEEQSLAADGEFLVADSNIHHDAPPTDYSYMVFPFAKLYEGFLKRLFTDLSIINERDYRSDHFRIGRVLSPGMVGTLRSHSAYGQIEKQFGKDLATRLWHTWKNGRNLIFHYFPHNYRSLSHDQAKTVTTMIVDTMEEAVNRTNADKEKNKIYVSY